MKWHVDVIDNVDMCEVLMICTFDVRVTDVYQSHSISWYENWLLSHHVHLLIYSIGGKKGNQKKRKQMIRLYSVSMHYRSLRNQFSYFPAVCRPVLVPPQCLWAVVRSGSWCPQLFLWLSVTLVIISLECFSWGTPSGSTSKEPLMKLLCYPSMCVRRYPFPSHLLEFYLLPHMV